MWVPPGLGSFLARAQSTSLRRDPALAAWRLSLLALIIARVGLNSQIVTQSTSAIVVFMAAATTILAPPLLRYLFRQEAADAA
jgi:Kef-type K+ transport system membrane component KefB